MVVLVLVVSILTSLMKRGRSGGKMEADATVTGRSVVMLHL